MASGLTRSSQSAMCSTRRKSKSLFISRGNCQQFLTDLPLFCSQAVETRHALHGVRWPTSNPKCLHVDFGAEVDMQKAIESTAEDLAKHADASRGERIVVGWERERIEGGIRVSCTLCFIN